MTSMPFRPSPLAFAENSVLLVLKSCVVRGLPSWDFPADNRAALKSLEKKGLVQVELSGANYQVELTPAGRSELGV